MTSRETATTADPRLTGALIGLLSHDLRSPLGPLALAASSIAEDAALPPGARELARFATAQGARVGRLIDAALWSVRGPSALLLREEDLGAIVGQAASSLESLGGRCVLDGAPARVAAHRTSLRDAVAGLLECAAGEGGDVRVAVTSGEVAATITITGSEPGRCGAIGDETVPANWRAAYALGARAVVAAHGGEIRFDEDQIVVTLPVAP